MSDKKLYYTSEQADKTFNCFNEKIAEIEKQYTDYFKDLDFDFDHIYIITNDKHRIAYNFLDEFRELPQSIQTEISESFNLAFNECFGKFSK